MLQRITGKILKNKVKYLNESLNRPVEFIKDKKIVVSLNDRRM